MARPYAASQIPPKTKETVVACSCESDEFLNVGHPSTQDDAREPRLCDVPLGGTPDVVCHVCLRNLLVADFDPLVLESSMRFY
jgi:hypothetical protein